ncbi:MAG: hypothetical protein ACUVTM_03800 [Candidatus Bathyarchaeia archaeon]
MSLPIEWSNSLAVKKAVNIDMDFPVPQGEESKPILPPLITSKANLIASRWKGRKSGYGNRRSISPEGSV